MYDTLCNPAGPTNRNAIKADKLVFSTAFVQHEDTNIDIGAGKT
jgi:hypothetical protein